MIYLRLALLLFINFVICRCGVKGDPVFPKTPTEIGRGTPTFKKAFRKVKVDEQYKKDIDDEETEREESNE